MPKQRGLGEPGRRRIAQGFEEAKNPSFHPLISSIGFAKAMREPFNEEGEHGATINVQSGKLIEVGSTEGYLVGGVSKGMSPKYLSNKEGTQIEPQLSDINTMRRNILEKHKDNPRVALGSWVDKTGKRRKKVDLDASEHILDYDEAFNTMVDRNERSMFHVKTGDVIKNPFYKEKTRKKKGN